MDSLRHIDHNDDQEKITKNMLASLAKRVLLLLMRTLVRNTMFLYLTMSFSDYIFLGRLFEAEGWNVIQH